MTILLILAAQASIGDADVFDLAGHRAPPSLSPRQGCVASSDPDTVTVCGKRKSFRLPLPVDHEHDVPVRARGGPSGMAALTPATRCGIFAGERSCGKAEAARYGYGRGRDPLSVLLKLGTRLVDPDADMKSASEGKGQ